MGKYFLFKFSTFFFWLIREHRNIHIFIYALTSRFVQRQSDSRSVPVSCSAHEHLLEMSLCGISPEAPGLHHTPATRAQMAAKQANYFNTKLWCLTQTLWGHLGILSRHCWRCQAGNRGHQQAPTQYLVSRWKAARLGCILVETKHLVSPIEYCLPSRCSLILKRIECPECFIGVGLDWSWKMQIHCVD